MLSEVQLTQERQELTQTQTQSYSGLQGVHSRSLLGQIQESKFINNSNIEQYTTFLQKTIENVQNMQKQLNEQITNFLNMFNQQLKRCTEIIDEEQLYFQYETELQGLFQDMKAINFLQDFEMKIAKFQGFYDESVKEVEQNLFQDDTSYIQDSESLNDEFSDDEIRDKLEINSSPFIRNLQMKTTIYKNINQTDSEMEDLRDCLQRMNNGQNQFIVLKNYVQKFKNLRQQAEQTNLIGIYNQIFKQQMSFAKNRKQIQQKQWLQELKKSRNVQIKKKKILVYEFLYNNGFMKAAEIFQKEADLKDNDVNKNRYDMSEIKNLVLQNLLQSKIEVTKELLISHIPDFFKDNPDILVELNLLNFLEMVKEQKFQEAIQFAKSNFIKELTKNRDEKVKERIKVILTTLAYKDLSKFPDQNILDQKNIYSISYKINKKIAKNKYKETQLEHLNGLIFQKQQSNIIKAKYPHLKRASELQFEKSEEIKDENQVAENPRVTSLFQNAPQFNRQRNTGDDFQIFPIIQQGQLHLI